jgi:hypothetical protein
MRKSDKTAIFAALAALAAGGARIVFAHDVVLGCALIGVGIAISVRAIRDFRKSHG